MKCTIPEISWHNREPVLSVDIHPVTDNFYRLASGGADCHVLVWQLTICETGAVKNDPLSDLTRHQRAVNAVRWSPNGQFLASADDDANIIIWQLKTDNIPLLEGESGDKEVWILKKVMRGHKEDIYDLCWSPDGLKLLSGSIDNTAILWDFVKLKSTNILTDHKGFVQGVAWDPKGLYIATVSTDRICRIYDSNGKQMIARVQKGLLPLQEGHYLHNKEIKFFHDDTFKSFFRRLDFSLDGSLLAVPSGRVETDEGTKILNATYIFAVENWTAPISVLPIPRQCSTVVKFCPILFELHEDGPDPIISLPYRQILAVGTDHDVILYDTQQTSPFAYFHQIHYTRLTDLTWSKDGLLLVASSTDGFCSLITFEPEELGKEYVKEELISETDDINLDVSGCEELEKVEEKKEEVEKVKKPTLLEKWTIKTPKKRKLNPDDKEKEKVDKFDVNEDNTKVVPKRITPITVTSQGKKSLNPELTTPKRIVPIPVRSNTTGTLSPNVLTPKRITPVPIKTSEKVLESTPKKTTPKNNQLLNFLKPKEISKTMTSPKKQNSTPPNALSEEVEARDAWDNETVENNTNATNLNTIDDVTEEFSLHLENTSSQIEATNNGEISDNLCNDKQNEKITENVVNELFEKPKRRIPLITLSSSKQKKK